MKFGKIEYISKKEAVVPIERHGTTYYFIFEAIQDFEVDKRPFKEPQPPMMVTPTGVEIAATEDPGYVAKRAKYWELVDAWMLLKSLVAIGTITGEGEKQELARVPVEWTKADINNADTYTAVDEELKAFGLNPIEIARLHSAVLEVNSVTGDAVERAKETFFAISQAARTEAGK